MKILLLLLLLTGCTIVEDPQTFCQLRQQKPKCLTCGFAHNHEQKSEEKKVPYYEFKWIPPIYDIQKIGSDTKGDPIYKLIEVRKGRHEKELKGFK